MGKGNLFSRQCWGNWVAYAKRTSTLISHQIEKEEEEGELAVAHAPNVRVETIPEIAVIGGLAKITPI